MDDVLMEVDAKGNEIMRLADVLREKCGNNTTLLLVQCLEVMKIITHALSKTENVSDVVDLSKVLEAFSLNETLLVRRKDAEEVLGLQNMLLKTYKVVKVGLEVVLIEAKDQDAKTLKENKDLIALIRKMVDFLAVFVKYEPCKEAMTTLCINFIAKMFSDMEEMTNENYSKQIGIINLYSEFLNEFAKNQAFIKPILSEIYNFFAKACDRSKKNGAALDSLEVEISLRHLTTLWGILKYVTSNDMLKLLEKNDWKILAEVFKTVLGLSPPFMAPIVQKNLKMMEVISTLETTGVTTDLLGNPNQFLYEYAPLI